MALQSDPELGNGAGSLHLDINLMSRKGTPSREGKVEHSWARKLPSFEGHLSKLSACFGLKRGKQGGVHRSIRELNANWTIVWKCEEDWLRQVWSLAGSGISIDIISLP